MNTSEGWLVEAYLRECWRAYWPGVVGLPSVIFCVTLYFSLCQRVVLRVISGEVTLSRRWVGSEEAVRGGAPHTRRGKYHKNRVKMCSKAATARWRRGGGEKAMRRRRGDEKEVRQWWGSGEVVARWWRGGGEGLHATHGREKSERNYPKVRSKARGKKCVFCATVLSWLRDRRGLTRNIVIIIMVEHYSITCVCLFCYDSEDLRRSDIWECVEFRVEGRFVVMIDTLLYFNNFFIY